MKLFLLSGAIALATLTTLIPQNLLAETPTITGVSTKITVVTPDQAVSLLKENPAFIVVDLRTAKEFAEEHIAKAQNVNYLADNFESELSKLDREKTYLIHCRSGKRSTGSLETWKKLGFKRLYHLDGGLISWKKSGNEVVKGS